MPHKDRLQLKGLLIPEEIKDYHEEWENLSDKYKHQLESPYNVHSGRPVIGKVFRFKEKPIFRAHVFKRKLKSFDPYFISNENYFYPYLHTTHYIFPIEQIWHASMSILCPDYYKFVCVDIFDRNTPPQMTCPIDFGSGDTSVDMVVDLRLGKNKIRAKGSATFYSDSENKIQQIWPFELFGRLRGYTKDVEQLRHGNEEVLDRLVSKINRIADMHRRLIT